MSAETTVSPKIFVVEGSMLLSHDKFPEWRKFRIYVRAVRERDAIEKVYSDLGSRHKLKRYHIKISTVKEVPLDQVDDQHIISLANATRIR